MLQEFSHEVKNTINELLHGVHTAIPGKIVKYYPDRCEAEILPYGKFKKPNGEWLDYPQLNHIPVLFPQSCGQDFAMVYPVRPGDECLILSQERTLDIWRNAGASSDNDLRHDLTNAVAIMGLFARAQPLALEAQNEDAFIVEKGGDRILIKEGGIYVRSSGSITCKAPVINLN